MGFICSHLSWCKISSPFSENNNIIVFPFTFHIFVPFKLWFIRLRGYFPILRTRNYPKLYPLIRPPRRPLALGRGRILILELFRSPFTLAVYDVAHSLPLRGIDRDLSFSEDETRRNFSYLSGTFKRAVCTKNGIILHWRKTPKQSREWGQIPLDQLARWKSGQIQYITDFFL